MPIARFHLCLVAAAALAAGGCAPSVRLDQPRTSLPAAFDAEQTALSASQEAEAIDRWWDRFGDPQLVELVDRALADSTDTRTAYFRLREARAIRDQSLSQRLPTGNLTGNARIQGGEQFSGVDFMGSTATAKSLSGAFSPAWEIDLFGRLAAIGRGARANYVAAAYDYHATRLSLAADVASALFEARGLLVQRNDAAETLRITEELAATSRLGLARGLVSGADTARLESDVATARAEVVRLDAALHNARRSLLVLTGRADAPVSSLPIEPRLDIPPAVPAAFPATLLTRRPDVLSAQARLAAAAAQVKVDRLALFPQFTLQGSGSITRTTGMLGGTNGLWSLASGVTLPILDRPRLMARLRATEAQGQQAVIAYEAAVQAAFRDADTALFTVASDRPRLAELTRAEERSRFAFEAARQGYRIGLTDLTTLLQSERSWRAARTALTIARSQALTNVVSAFRALGGGWDPAAPAIAPGHEPVPLPVAADPPANIQTPVS
ncbi:TolC family protein [Sphingobium sp. DC-2]|uniref:TolC family protein n=1 Tax=Sphingobium sp. DC-2 TaxID=1303256 RepID=UPI00138E0386|nr:TolC family protein [Sphingobium sp. DC-2]